VTSVPDPAPAPAPAPVATPAPDPQPAPGAPGPVAEPVAADQPRAAAVASPSAATTSSPALILPGAATSVTFARAAKAAPGNDAVAHDVRPDVLGGVRSLASLFDGSGPFAGPPIDGVSPVLGSVVAPIAFRQQALRRAGLAPVFSPGRDHGRGDPGDRDPAPPPPSPVPGPSGGAAAAAGVAAAMALAGRATLVVAFFAFLLNGLYRYRFSLAVWRPVPFVSLLERPG
jgi:hypothetical protein